MGAVVGRVGNAPRVALPSLTGLRAVAALAVFGFHTAGFGTLANGAWRGLSVGFVGVGFFFVLSGVVLAWSARPGQSARSFWGRRAARIYPAHLVTALLATVVYLAVIPPHKPLWALPLVLLLVQAWATTQTVQSAGDGVSWSLSCEALFYAVFPTMLTVLRRRTLRQRAALVGPLLAGCTAAALWASFGAGGRWDVIAYEQPLVRLGEFALGVCLGLALADGWRPTVTPRLAWLSVGAAWGALLAVGVVHGWPVPRGFADVVALGPLVLLLGAYAGRDLAGHVTWLGSRRMVYLGQLSFAFYLVHQVVMDLLVRRVAPVTTVTVPVALGWTAAGLLLSGLAAAALHHGVELPAQRALLRRRSPVSSGSTSAASVYPDDVTPAPLSSPVPTR